MKDRKKDEEPSELPIVHDKDKLELVRMPYDLRLSFNKSFLVNASFSIKRFINLYHITIIDVLLFILILFHIFMSMLDSIFFVDNEYQLDESNENIRILIMVVTIICVILLITKYIIKFILAAKIKKKEKLVETMFHFFVSFLTFFVFSYPGVTKLWTYEYNDEHFVFSLCNLLNILSLSRFYCLENLTTHFSFYFTKRSYRILEISKVVDKHKFVKKTVINQHSFSFFLFLFLTATLVFSQMFTIFEYYSSAETLFRSYHISYWFVIESVLHIGYGDLVIHSIQSKIFSLFVMLTGIALTSFLLTSTIELLEMNELEKQAYHELDKYTSMENVEAYHNHIIAFLKFRFDASTKKDEVISNLLKKFKLDILRTSTIYGLK